GTPLRQPPQFVPPPVRPPQPIGKVAPPPPQPDQEQVHIPPRQPVERPPNPFLDLVRHPAAHHTSSRSGWARRWTPSTARVPGLAPGGERSGPGGQLPATVHTPPPYPIRHQICSRRGLGRALA